MVYVLLADGFEEAEALVPLDLLRRAGIETALVSIGGEQVRSAHEITVNADLLVGQIDMDKAQMLVLPGGSEGVKNLGASATVESLLAAAVERDIWLAAICAAPTLLARLGYLDGSAAVCYPSLFEKMQGAQVKKEQDVVQAGKIITAKAAGVSFDFGLKLVSVLAGADKAQEIQDAVYYR